MVPEFDHRSRVGAGFRAGQAEARNFTAVGEPRQPALALLFRAKADQQFAGAERVRHHHGDGGSHRARRDLAHDFGMRIGREAEAAELLRNDHAEEAMLLDERPGLRRQVAPFPVDLPVVEHGAELVDRAMQEGVFFRHQRRRFGGEQLRPVRVAGEQIAVEPDVAGFQCLTLGIGHRRHCLLRPREDRPCQKITTPGGVCGRGRRWAHQGIPL